MVVILKLTDFVEFQLNCFKVLGLASLGGDVTLQRKTKLLLKIYHHTLIASLLLFLITTIVFVKNNIHDLNLISEVVAGTGMGFLAIIKLLSIPSNKKEFRHLFQTLSNIFPTTQEDQKKYGVRRHFFWFNLMRSAMKMLFLSSGLTLSLSPIIEFIATGSWFRKLPILSWYPVDEYDPRFYNLILLWQWCCILTIHVSFLAQDLTLYAFITLISMQFDILCERLQTLNTGERIDKDAKMKLIELFKLHKTLIELSENLKKIFLFATFFNFFESSIYICLFGYQITAGSSWGNTMKSVVLLVSSLLQIFMLCYYGNKLANASVKVAQAAYDSGWYRHRFENGKDVRLMLQRAQKPIFLTAYKFSVVSLEVFSSVSNFT